MPENPSESVAWLLALGGRLRAAVSEREFVHLLENPTLFEVPMSPAHCRHVVAWNNLLLPVMDLSLWLHDQPLEAPRPLVGVFAHQVRRSPKAGYGALVLSGIPTRTQVTDDMACGLPKNPPTWRSVAISCFKHESKATPILDLPQIFGGALAR
ncbi:MAG: hypothetical protein V9G63_01555 [Candidatus Competibacter sp.]|nr:hypothetical protein [Candidatus Competibacteraceae bacterium]